MLFRFLATLTILTGISIVGIALEKQNLTLKQKFSQQHYELHELEEQRCRLFLKTQQLGAPPRLFRDWNSEDFKLAKHRRDPGEVVPVPPVLEWQLRSGAAEERFLHSQQSRPHDKR